MDAVTSTASTLELRSSVCRQPTVLFLSNITNDTEKNERMNLTWMLPFQVEVETL